MDPVVALPVKIQPGLLRPLAYRVLSKKYGLNIKSDGLAALADYIGNRFGINWRKDSGTLKFLEQFATIWDQQERGLFIDKTGVEEVVKEVKEQSKADQNVSGQKQAPGETRSSNKPKTLDSFLVRQPPQQTAALNSSPIETVDSSINLEADKLESMHIEEDSERPVSMESVSYTHLDVYKRQATQKPWILLVRNSTTTRLSY